MQARLAETAAEKAEADALILPIFEGQTQVPREALALDRKLKGAVEQLLKDREFRGKFMELVPIHNLNTVPSRWTVLVGLESRSSSTWCGSVTSCRPPAEHCANAATAGSRSCCQKT